MSQLYIKAEHKGKITAISESFFTSPLKIAKPFYHENYTEAMMMTASAGIMDGDFYDIQLEVAENSNLKFTGQSYTKLFKAVNNGASQNIKITVGDNAHFLYCQTPIIPFEGSIFRSNMEVHLSKSSHFAMLDVISCGRRAMNEEFSFDLYRSISSVYVDDRLVFLDNQRLAPKEINLSEIGFFEKYTHIGMLYVYGYDIEELPENDNIQIGISDTFRGKCIRILGNNGEDIIRISEEILGGKNYGLFFSTGS